MVDPEINHDKMLIRAGKIALTVNTDVHSAFSDSRMLRLIFFIKRDLALELSTKCCNYNQKTELIQSKGK